MPTSRPPSFQMIGLLLSAVTILVAPAHAETNQTAPPDILLRTPVRNVEVTTGTQQLTGGYSAWRNLTVRGVLEKDNQVFQGEISSKREYDTSGVFFGLTDTVTINDDWFTSASIGAGDGAFYLPRIRLDGFLYKKWLPKKNFITSIGLGYYNAPDGHVDRSLSLGGAYYFAQPLVVEAGVRFNRSSPGSVYTRQQYIATNYSPDNRNTWSGRVAWGSEGYLPLAANTNLVDFNSQEASLSWRHRLDRHWGISISVNHYRNPTYERSGADIGFSRQFD
ncbi:YaiO family outer membrane beta-barrel protein [Actimicrobium antarcticum]|uniref:YaiO beta-barrel domain-containing protein n=1 Tax=Actimicrobium antarcticum TaxID=1051899 RepID=A0ABP7TMF8_9BURK